jgi:hypothetical protein
MSMRRCLSIAVIAAGCSGCVGISTKFTGTQELDGPVPLMTEDKERWACRPEAGGSAPLGKSDFLATWGEPAEKRSSAKGETWIYRESGRWCGVVLFAIIPVPLLLPVCETSDNVHFEGSLGVRATSRRLVGTAVAVGLGGHGGFGAYHSRSGRAYENRPWVAIFPERTKGVECPTTVAQLPASAQKSAGPGTPAPSAPVNDLVNCSVKGARQWTDRANCD